MKWLILSLSLLISLFTYSQDTINVDSSYIELDTTSVNIDFTLTEVVLDNFVTDAIQCGLDSLKVVNHIKKLDGIWLQSLDFDKFGITVCMKDSLSPIGIRGAIFIDESLIHNYSIFKFTIYHELGHWFGLEHTKRKGIMMRNSDDIFKVLDKWENHTKKLMRKIGKNEFSYPTP